MIPIRSSLSSLSISQLQDLSKKLRLETPGHGNWKATYTAPIEKHFVDNETALKDHPDYQKYFISGSTSSGPPRPTSEDKVQQDAAAAASAAVSSKKPTPCVVLIMISA